MRPVKLRPVILEIHRKNPKLDVAEIARRAGASHNYVREVLRKYRDNPDGVFRVCLRIKRVKLEFLHYLDKYYDRSRMTERSINIALEVAMGVRYTEIGVKYGVSVGWVSRLANRFDILRKPPFDPAVRKKAVAEFFRGENSGAILHRYGISRTTLARWTEEALVQPNR